MGCAASTAAIAPETDIVRFYDGDGVTFTYALEGTQLMLDKDGSTSGPITDADIQWDSIPLENKDALKALVAKAAKNKHEAKAATSAERIFEYKEWDAVPSKLGGEVVLAKWGNGKTMVDVLPIVKEKLAKNQNWHATFEVLGDPTPGDGKLLVLTIKKQVPAGRQSQTIRYHEGQTVPSEVEGDLFVATWGSGNSTKDVTSIVEKLLSKGTAWQVQNDLLGGDPCPGAAKTLVLMMLQLMDGFEEIIFKEHEKVPFEFIGQLLEAQYGSAKGCFVDVTSHVQAQLTSGKTSFPANNKTLGGDPCPGLGKRLRLIIKPKHFGDSCCSGCAPERPIGGGMSLILMVEAWDGQTLLLPAGSVGSITGCSYGAGKTWVDPRKFVEAGLKADGSLNVIVNSKTLGGDPLPGKVKSLRISYTLHQTRRLLADEGEWEVHEDHDVDLEFCMSGPSATQEDLAHARRRCLLLGCGGFRLTRGTVNQFGEVDQPGGCEQLRFTQDQIRKALHPRAPRANDSMRNKSNRPGIHIAPKAFQTDTTWRPGNDPAPAPNVCFTPEGRFCAVAQQICVPLEGLAEGTYYSFGGFHCGYGGIQQFGDDKQTITFSVWNAARGGRSECIEAGPGATGSNFGGEGMGSGLVYDTSGPHVKWVAGNTYTWLLRATPDGDATIYTAHIFKPEEGRWRLIGSHRRPDPDEKEPGKLEFLHGFLEDAGATAQRRSADYGPCWIQRTTGAWESVTKFDARCLCSRPNKAVHVTEDKRRVRMSAGGAAWDPPPGKLHISGFLEAAPVPDCLSCAPGTPPTYGWACSG